jgi:hypothetical protein
MRCSSSPRSTIATRPVAAIADTADPIAKPLSTARRFGACGFRQRSLDAPAQLRRSCITQIGAGDRLAHLAITQQLRGATRAAGDMVFDLARVSGVEFAVDQRVKKNFSLVASHFGCSSSAIHADRSMARARARRDITVPTGTSDDIGDFAVRKIVNFTQHECLPERFGKGAHEPPDRGRVPAGATSAFPAFPALRARAAVVRRFQVTSSMAALGELARRANSARQTLRRIANSQGFIAGPR